MVLLIFAVLHANYTAFAYMKYRWPYTVKTQCKSRDHLYKIKQYYVQVASTSILYGCAKVVKVVMLVDTSLNKVCASVHEAIKTLTAS